MQRAPPTMEGLQEWGMPRSHCGSPALLPRCVYHMPALRAFLLTKLVFPMKIEVCSCWGEASCWHREGGQRRHGQTSYWVKNAAVCQFRAVWQKVSLPLHFPDCIQLFAIPSCLFSNLVSSDSSALVCSSFPPKPPALPACSFAHQPTGANLLPGLVPLAQPSQVISPSPSWRKVSESPFICISVFDL